MVNLGDYTQDVPFNWAAAEELIADLRSTATSLGSQIGERVQLSAAARQLWEGLYAQQFDGRIGIGTRDAQRFATTMQTAAGELEELAGLARWEQERRLLAREWVAELPAYEAAGLPPPPPPPPPLEPPMLPAFDSPPMPRGSSMSAAGGTGQSSADPERLDRWVTTSRGLDESLSSRRAALEGSHEAFSATSRWGNFDASRLIGSFRTYIGYNETDVQWTETIAGLFRRADSAGGVTSRPNAEIEAGLRAGLTGARQPAGPGPDAGVPASTQPYSARTRTNEQLALDRNLTLRLGETPQQAQARARAAQDELAMRDAVRQQDALGDRAPRVNTNANVNANLESAGREKPTTGTMRTGAKQGAEPTPETIREGSVRMEDHPQYQKVVDDLAERGFKIVKTTADPHVEIRRVVDLEGNVIRTERLVHVQEGMRFLDLEHEVGHVNQVTDRARFPRGPVPNEGYVENLDKTLSPDKNRSGILTPWQDSIVEYHNRLQEVVALAERGASPAIINEHLAGVDHWAELYMKRGLKGRRSPSRVAWADEHFPDIGDLRVKVSVIREQLRAGTGGGGGVPPVTSS